MSRVSCDRSDRSATIAARILERFRCDRSDRIDRSDRRARRAQSEPAINQPTINTKYNTKAKNSLSLRKVFPEM
jgi:hypothetical protein